jgi:hypothetical protein
LYKCGLTEAIWSSNQFCTAVRAGQATLSGNSYLQQIISNQQRFPADGILIPHLHKALYVSGKPKVPDGSMQILKKNVIFD